MTKLLKEDKKVTVVPEWPKEKSQAYQWQAARQHKHMGLQERLSLQSAVITFKVEMSKTYKVISF